MDLGLWPFVPTAKLVCPLDTWIARIARNLRLTRRKSPGFAMALDVTESLRAFDAEDPLKYDFALCHLGIALDCPSRREPARCAPCAVRPMCLHWQEARA